MKILLFIFARGGAFLAAQLFSYCKAQIIPLYSTWDTLKNVTFFSAFFKETT
jgi:hypothetical protein